METPRIPAYTRGQRRKTSPPYVKWTRPATQARRHGAWQHVRQLRHQAQRLPSRDPQAPKFRRLGDVRSADARLLGLTGPKSDARLLKNASAAFRRDERHRALRDEKTLITPARAARAQGVGYDGHSLHENSQHDHRRQRGLKGSGGWRIPREVRPAKGAASQRRGTPVHLPQRPRAAADSLVAPDQAEARGIVPYYRLAYNRHTLHNLKRDREEALVRTWASTYRTPGTKMSQRYGTTIHPGEGASKVLPGRVKRPPPKPAVTAYGGGVSLPSHPWVSIHAQPTPPRWRGRSDVVERLLAQDCALCGSDQQIAVHHVRQRADLHPTDGAARPAGKRRMAARRRKTLVVCRACHERIQYGNYDGKTLQCA